MKSTIQNYEVVESTSTTLCVQILPNVRLYAQRHSNRFTGSSMWSSWFEKFAEWGYRENPFDRSEITYRKQYARIKATTYRDVKLVRTWNKKSDLIDAINSTIK